MPAGGYINGQRPKEADGSVSLSEGEKSKRKHDPFYVTGTSSENLLAYGMLPESRLIDQEKMQKTLVRAAQKLELVRRILELELSHIGNECYSPVAA